MSTAAKHIVRAVLERTCVGDIDENDAEFVGACAWLDVQYGTRTSPDDPEWDDPLERRAHVNHARSMGWKPARELS